MDPGADLPVPVHPSGFRGQPGTRIPLRGGELYPGNPSQQNYSLHFFVTRCCSFRDFSKRCFLLLFSGVIPCQNLLSQRHSHPRNQAPGQFIPPLQSSPRSLRMPFRLHSFISSTPRPTLPIPPPAITTGSNSTRSPGTGSRAVTPQPATAESPSLLWPSSISPCQSMPM